MNVRMPSLMEPSALSSPVLLDHERVFAFLISFPCPDLRCPAIVPASMKYRSAKSLIAVALLTPLTFVLSM